jgi:hypothetical protein
MAIFTITNQQNITQLQNKTGDDTYTINGGSLTIDCDSRFGPNQSQNTGPIGNINISATLGGELLIKSTNIRLIPFNQGSGTVPAAGTIISHGNAQAELLCVIQHRTGGTVYTGTMPSSGWLKVRNATSEFTSGNLQGISANATSVSEPGWIVVAGVDTRIYTIPRMGSMQVQGSWFEIGTTSGSRGQTAQLPYFSAESVVYYPGVDIETSPGSGEYVFWHNVGTKFTSANMSTDSRCRFVHISTTGILTIGQGTDSLPAGDLPQAGCKIRVPGIILQTCSAANKTVNNEPSGNMSNRYEAQFSGAGVLNHNISTGSWYWNLIQAYSLDIRNLHTTDQFIVGECALPPYIDQVHVGLSTRTTAIAAYSFVVQQCYNGGKIGIVSAVRADSMTTNSYCVVLVNLYENWVIDKVRGCYAQDVTAISAPVFVNMCDDMLIHEAEVIGKRFLLFSSNRVKIKKIVYADNVKSLTQITNGSHALETTTQSRDCSVENIQNWPLVANVHPYNGVVYCSGATGLKVRNIGSPDAPFDAGTTNPTGYLYSDGGNNIDIRLQRCWLKNLRLNLSSSTNTSNKQVMENCYNVDASKTHGAQQLNALIRGNRQNAGNMPSSFVSVYGLHFWDAFTGDTTARLSIVFTEKTAYTAAAYVIDSGNPKFTSQGAITMQQGDSITWTWTHSILGWNGLTSHIRQGTKTTNFTYEYDLDKGNGFSGTFKVLNDTNLQAETGISPTGFKPRVRISCHTSDPTNLITSFRIDGTTTLALQNAAMYPLDTAKLTLTNVQVGSSIAVFEGIPAVGAVPITFANDSTTSAVMQYPYNDNIQHYTVRIRKAGYDVVELLYNNALNVSIPLAQQENKDGFGVAILGRGEGSTNHLISFDANALRIDISNARVIAEDLYDVVANWQATEVGIRYPEAIRFDGTDVLVVNSWLFRRKEAGYTNAGLDALPIVDGQPGVSPDDESNGSVDFKARSVRTFDSDGAVMTNASIAEAVQAQLQNSLATLETKIENPLHAAANPNQDYWVITQNGNKLIGVTLDNPFGRELNNFSIHQMQGAIPDLNFYAWDYEMDTFKCTLYTKILFLAKFTVAEMLGIRTSNDAIVKSFIERIDSSRYVNLQEQLNIDNINYLVQVALITPERAIEIMR